MTGGREVFARDGYARASIDAIATASETSTRTIYKHFADKRALFVTVIVDSAVQVAEAEIALIERHLSTAADAGEVETVLLAFATDWLDDTGDWLAGMAHSAAHRALIGQVRSEAAHLGTEVITRWWEAARGGSARSWRPSSAGGPGPGCCTSPTPTARRSTSPGWDAPVRARLGRPRTRRARAAPCA
ncbi:TetR/AcrR family transcriptional regulator [Streptomyces cyaneofuscatus]|uniref:TetR/AcrR family transcriptional regulator n=1 Tax=Streptomyces cyaneofuscatus TaxID=66883 RepID=UPI00365EB9D4